MTEVVAEEEVSPTRAHHRVRWQGDYYVSDSGVSVLGFGRKGGGKPIPFDQPRTATNEWGSTSTSTLRRIPDGIEVTIEYGTFVLTRTVRKTGEASCSDTVTAVLKPGHALYEVHRLRNHELMLETRRDYVLVRCEIPALTS